MTPVEEPIRILVADDHPTVREGIRALLSGRADMDLIGEASTGDEAATLAAAMQPDVVIMDLRMPGLNGIDATRQITANSPRMAVLVLTMLEDDDSIFAAMRAGALGYLLKGAGRDEMTRAIHAVANGEAIYSPAIAQHIIGYFSNAGLNRYEPFAELTQREREVLDLIAAGLNNSAIAVRLFLSPKTVKNHISNIFMKMQVTDRAQAIIRARDAGLGH
jgi:DNA-binding NarL/FixJ family response regulator